MAYRGVAIFVERLVGALIEDRRSPRVIDGVSMLAELWTSPLPTVT